jgi:hypothetical protein
LKEPFDGVALIALLNPYANRRQSGDSVHPYEIYLSGLKKGEVALLINTAKESQYQA